ncbi:MAG: hypothetical protein GY782_08450 [Gammaproteobacteria bacterium]|nr:hypothetical protein [Gammaproteobacteria bacterium]
MRRYKVISPCKERDKEGKSLRRLKFGAIVSDLNGSEIKRLIKAKCIELYEEIEEMTEPIPENRMRRRGRKRKA